jgi:hypothetical protein
MLPRSLTKTNFLVSPEDSPDSDLVFVPEFFNVLQSGSAGCTNDGMLERAAVLDHNLQIFSQRIELFLVRFQLVSDFSDFVFAHGRIMDSLRRQRNAEDFSVLVTVAGREYRGFMKVNRRRMRHLLGRTLLENFFLFLALALIQLSFALANPQFSLAFLLALSFGTLGCGVMSVLRFICYGLEWCVDKGILKESPRKTVRK